MEFRRTIKLGMSGADVLYIKRKLFDLGMYSNKIKRITSNKFRIDSVNATKKFQETYDSVCEGPLEVTGTIYEACWEAIEAAARGEIKPKVDPDPGPDPTPAPEPEPEPKKGMLDSYTWIKPSKRRAIEKDLLDTNEMRRSICLEILKWCYDPDYRSGDVRALYMWGGNLYNTDLRLNIATAAKIEVGAKRYPDKYDGGRKEWMLSEVAKYGDLPASDCSGMEVGWLRKFKLVNNKFDSNANTLGSAAYSVECEIKNLKPGTFAHRDGHLGTYVGGGYIVEFVGGAYGCQLTDRTNRKVWNFVEKKTQKMSAWKDFWDFKELLKYDN